MMKDDKRDCPACEEYDNESLFTQTFAAMSQAASPAGLRGRRVPALWDGLRRSYSAAVGL